MVTIEDRQQPPGFDASQIFSNDLFKHLLVSERSMLALARRHVAFSEGEMILQADQRASNIHIVIRGRVNISVFGRNGRERIIRVATDGDLLDYRSALTGDAYAVYAIAMGAIELWAIPAGIFLTLARTNIDFAFDIITKLSTDLTAAEVEAATCMHKSVGERLAETLLDLVEKHGVDPHTFTLRIDLTRVELAKIIGTTTETVSRILSRFQRDKIIALTGPKIRIVDRRTLTSRANGEG